MPSAKNGKQISLYVTPERKERWQKYIEGSSEVNTMSNLIRTGVETYISREENRSDRTEHQSGETSTGMDDTVAVGILDTLNSIDERLSVLEREQGRPDGPDLQRVIFELLPTEDSSDDPIPASAMARKIDADVSLVREALDDLTKTTAVHAREIESGRTGYFRIGSGL